MWDFIMFSDVTCCHYETRSYLCRFPLHGMHSGKLGCPHKSPPNLSSIKEANPGIRCELRMGIVPAQRLMMFYKYRRERFMRNSLRLFKYRTQQSVDLLIFMIQFVVSELLKQTTLSLHHMSACPSSLFCSLSSCSPVHMCCITDEHHLFLV